MEIVASFDDEDVYEDVKEALEEGAAKMGVSIEKFAGMRLEDALFDDDEEEDGVDNNGAQEEKKENGDE